MKWEENFRNSSARSLRNLLSITPTVSISNSARTSISKAWATKKRSRTYAAKPFKQVSNSSIAPSAISARRKRTICTLQSKTISEKTVWISFSADNVTTSFLTATLARAFASKTARDKIKKKSMPTRLSSQLEDAARIGLKNVRGAQHRSRSRRCGHRRQSGSAQRDYGRSQ